MSDAAEAAVAATSPPRPLTLHLHWLKQSVYCLSQVIGSKIIVVRLGSARVARVLVQLSLVALHICLHWVTRAEDVAAADRSASAFCCAASRSRSAFQSPDSLSRSALCSAARFVSSASRAASASAAAQFSSTILDTPLRSSSG